MPRITKALAAALSTPEVVGKVQPICVMKVLIPEGRTFQVPPAPSLLSETYPLGPLVTV